MGLLRHVCAVAHNWGWAPDVHTMKEGVESINEAWKDLERPFPTRPLVTMSGPHTNGSITWLFAVDGSKEGWDTSDHADALRQRFVELCNSCQYTDVAVIGIGGDECEFWSTYPNPRRYEEAS